MDRRRVRILLVEDRVSDAELVLHELRRGGIDPDWVRVDDEPHFRARLTEGWDLILADFNLPQFDALRALEILKESKLDIPFIIVSGSIGEKAAVDSMQGGASDYIFKDNLSRLAAAAVRELDAAEKRKRAAISTEESMDRLAAVINAAMDAMISVDARGRLVDWNRAAEALFGWSREEAVGLPLAQVILPESGVAAHRARLQQFVALPDGSAINRRLEMDMVRRDGTVFPAEASFTRFKHEGEWFISAFVQDITEQRQAQKSTNAHLSVSRALTEAGAIDDVLPKALEAIGLNLGWDVGQVWLGDPEARTLRCAYRWLAAGASVSEFDAASATARFSPGEGMVGRVWVDRKSLWLEDLREAADPALVEATKRSGLLSAAFTPMMAGGAMIGVLEFFSHQRQAAENSVILLLEDLSRRMGEFVSRSRTEAALRESESRFRGLFFDMAVGQALLSLPDARVVAANPAFCRLLGYDVDELIGKSSQVFVDPDKREAADRTFASLLSLEVPSFHGEAQLVRKDGAKVWATVSASATFDVAGRPQSLLVQAQDITKRRQAEQELDEAQQQLRYRARFDQLTDLPNRMQLEERLQEAIRDSPVTPVSLLVMNLDHFKEVNDSFGHLAGDELLKAVGPRIRECVRRDDLVARLGGDEFGVVLIGANPEVASQVAEKLKTALEQPFTIHDHALAVEASIGIASYPDHGPASVILMRRADIAMHIAKRTRGASAVYGPEFEEEGASHLALMADLRAAIQEDSLSVNYQPLIDLKTGLVVRFEALLRWKHPTRGMVPPDQFIPFAEQTGVIQPLTDWVLKTVLNQTKQWHQAGHDLGVAVNISMRNLLDPGLPERIGLMLDEAAASTYGGVRLLSLEVTEGVLMADPARAIERLSRLRRLGIRLSVDDFGTGYSSLAYLSRLPVNEMKIDRSFIMGIADDPSKAAIVRAALDLGHNLRLEVVAEGVEDQRTWDLLFALGCDTAQGYHMSRPMPADAVLPWLVSSKYGGTAKTDKAA